MFQFKQSFPTPKEHHAWVNTCEFIVIHHTWSWAWTTQWVINGLQYRDDFASCHFLISDNWEAYKFWDPKDILWHAWVSEWKWKTDLNRYSVGIEVIWPINWQFTSESKLTLRKLTQHLMAVLKIDKSNAILHRQIAPKRKIDPLESLFDAFWWFTKWQSTLKAKEQK